MRVFFDALFETPQAELFGQVALGINRVFGPVFLEARCIMTERGAYCFRSLGTTTV